MNIAYYIDQINQEEKTTELFNKMNEDLENGAIDNGSVFYKEIGPSSIQPKFGMFNSTEIWHFTGTLIATSMETFLDAIKAVNKYSLAYLFYGDVGRDVFALIGISKNTKILTTTEDDQKEVYRLTGKKPILLEDVSPSKIQKALG
jgi:hypothetical protein|tara:strand:+ start:217 stop:654 length:438 start_codon:yes stop_codon:yes gene_type:complete